MLETPKLILAVFEVCDLFYFFISIECNYLIVG